MAVMSVSLPSVPFSSNQKYATTCFEIALTLIKAAKAFIAVRRPIGGRYRSVCTGGLASRTILDIAFHVSGVRSA